MIRARHKKRTSFTLVELMIVTAMIALLAITTLFALYAAMERARGTRTQAQIAKINELIMERWDTFATRKIPLAMDPAIDLRTRARVRLLAIRELMRMELPDRITDVADPPTAVARSSLSKSFVRRVRSVVGANWYLDPQPESPPLEPDYWTFHQQSSECLYMILASMRDEDSTGIDFFKPNEIGDTDGDRMPEILDAWGRPIKFLRWAPSFVTLQGDGGWGVFDVDDDGDGTRDNQTEAGWPGTDDRSELQSRNAQESPDPFDPLHVDLRWQSPDPRFDLPELPFGLFPLIYSSGPDGLDGISSAWNTNPSQGNWALFHYSTTEFSGQPWPNDPYFTPPQVLLRMGRPAAGSEDNITNHLSLGN